MAIRPLPPLEFLRECFDYDPDTGALIWRHRPIRHFASPGIAKGWNSKMAGKPALNTLDPDGHRKGEVDHNGRRYRVFAHRVIFALMTGEEPDFVDHRNCDGGDNRWLNLRAATAAQNAQNNMGQSTSVLPKCVSFDAGKFRPYSYRPDGRKIHLGAFKTPAEAHAAFCAYAAPLYGEFFNPGPHRPSVFD